MNSAFYKTKDTPLFFGDDTEQEEQNLKEFVELCRPVVEYLQKKYHPHARIIVEWDRASLVKDLYGVPFQVPD